MPTCPKGHTSTATDWCDVCGAPMPPTTPTAPAEPAAAAAPATTGAPAATVVLRCPNCGADARRGSLFCENCGYDFTTGVRPGPARRQVPEVREVLEDPEVASGTSAPTAPPPAALPTGAPSSAALPSGAPQSDVRPAPAAPPVPVRPVGPTGWVAELWIDPDWYRQQKTLDQLPSPGLPEVVRLNTVNTIGRPSASRGSRPDLNCGSDTGVSRTHASLSTDGSRWFIEDLGSANGTFLGSVDAALPVEPISGRREIGPTERIYLGIWTRIVVRPGLPEELTTP